MSHSPHPCAGFSTDPADYFTTRRQFLSRVGGGLGALSLATMLDPMNLAAAETGVGVSPLAPKAPHFTGKAKAVIQIFAQGAPSQVDTWDPKPLLTKMNGKTLAGGGSAVGTNTLFLYATHSISRAGTGRRLHLALVVAIEV
jgi:hypothetical protein